MMGTKKTVIDLPTRPSPEEGRALEQLARIAGHLSSDRVRADDPPP
jgi:hypothetical protein